jgi:hypothetical protein
VKPLTPEERHELATRPLGTLGIFRHSGARYGGVAVAHTIGGRTSWSQRGERVRQALGPKSQIDPTLYDVD